MWESNKEIANSRRNDKSIITCTLYNRVKGNATARNREFNLEKDYFYNLVTSRCYYCDADPSMICNPHVKIGGRKGKRGYNYERFALYNGIDRVDNAKGYIMGNVVSCCNKCNRAKDDMTQTDFFQMIKRIFKHMKLECL